MERKQSEWLTRIKGKRWVVLVLILGLVLLLMPSGKKVPEVTTEASAEQSFSLETEEARLCAAVQELEGVTDAAVLLSLDATAQRELAENAEGPLVLSSGNSGEQTVELRRRYPEYRGAVVVWQGSGGASTGLDITQITAAFTGLRTDKIIVKNMEKQ